MATPAGLRLVLVILLLAKMKRRNGGQQANVDWLLIVLGLLVLAAGAVQLLGRSGGTHEVAVVGRRWWPLLLIGLGLVNLIRLSDRGWALFGPLLAIGTGAAVLLFILDVVPSDVYPSVWTIGLGLVGGTLILVGVRQRASRLSDRTQVHQFVWLRVKRLESTARPFVHGRITVVLGAFTLDLRRAMVSSSATIEITVLFGSVEVFVDDETTVVVRRPFDSRIHDPFRNDLTPNVHHQLTMSVLAFFGDAKIRRPLEVAPSVASSGPPAPTDLGGDSVAEVRSNSNQPTGKARAPLWTRSHLIRPSAPPRRRFRQRPPENDGIRETLYLLAEQIDDQRELAWHDARRWNRRGVLLSSLAALGSAFTGAAVATTDTLDGALRTAVVIVAFLGSGLGAAAAAVRAPERAAAVQVRFARLDSLSRRADYVELIELPALERQVQALASEESKPAAEELVKLVKELEVSLDEINNVSRSPLSSE
jgi:hypothetical protein